MRQQQQLFYGGRYHASRFHAEPDFAAIARGFGIARLRPRRRRRSARQRWRRRCARPGPCLINVPIDAEENVYPMVPPGGANRDMIGGEIHAARADSDDDRLRSGRVLRLLVRNHPGVMSHVCGLFARRAFNVEGILCLPVGDGTRSAILLLVNEDERLEQVIRQLRKLEDVVAIERADAARGVFSAAARDLVS